VRSSSNAIKLGSESSGAFRDVRVRGCTLVYRPAPGVSERIAEGGGLALEMVDGGTLEDVVVEEVEIQGVPAPIFVRLGNRGREQKPKVPGRLRNVVLRGIRATGASVASSITGLPEARVQGVRLEDVEIGLAPGRPSGRWAEELASVPERPDAYPTPRMFGVPPAAGLYCRHVEGLAVAGLRFAGGGDDPRPALVADDLRGGRLAGLRVGSAPAQGPVVWLEQARGVSLEAPQGPPGTALLLRVTGEGSSGIELAGELPAGATPFELGPGVAPDAVRLAGHGA
jgi:hypothetical protein